MLKKILASSLIVLHILTQSAGAFEFRSVLQSIAVQPTPALPLQGASVDANNKTTAYQYDERQLLFKVTDSNTPVAGVTQYDYDTNGNLKKLTDAKTNATNYAFDNFDRLTTETFPDTRTNVYTFDKNSNAATRTTPNAQQIQYTYDNLNRLTNQNYPSDSTMNITYAYDVGSLLTSAANSFSTNAYTYDALNRVLTNTQTLNAVNYTVTYAYNKLNQTGVTYPSSKNVTYAYNANDLLTTLSVGGVALMNLTYDTLMRRAQKNLTGTATKQAIYTYNLADELTSLNNKISGGATISKHDYTYDNVSNRLTHVITAAANKNYTYIYNNIYELTGVTGSETSAYAYDKLGNRITANGTAYATNNLNQYTTVGGVARSYDNNGNLTGDGANTYGYDVESRLKTFSKTGTTASYKYDAFNRRVSKTVNSTTIYYVYDGDDIIEERSSTGALNADWVHGDNIDEPLTMKRGANTYYYFADGLGSIRQLTNAAGAVQEAYTYNSYGLLAAAPGIVNPFTYTGREYDSESGNYYYRARTYSPVLGRFLQRDPIGYYDSMNIYKYVHNNSIRYTDPFGLGQFGRRPLGGKQWDPNFSQNPFLDDHNIEYSHEHYFYDDGTNVGYGPSGPFYIEKPDDYRFYGPHYDDERMRRAEKDIESRWIGNQYCLIGHNCQDYSDALRDQYDKLANQENDYCSETKK